MHGFTEWKNDAKIQLLLQKLNKPRRGCWTIIGMTKNYTLKVYVSHKRKKKNLW
jgi:hypothetical protein